MNSLRRATLFLAAALIIVACNDSKSSDPFGSKCQSSADCEGLVCVNQICINPCEKGSCDAGQVCGTMGICAPGECSVIDPCSDSSKQCINSTCISTCSDKNPCAAPAQACSNGFCVAGECSDSTSCADSSKICQNNKCVYECTDTVPCTETNAICQNNRCVFECTAAKPCADSKKICRNGKCENECSDSVPCAESSQLCVNGQCVQQQDTCTVGSCETGKACGEDGNCFTSECSSIDKCGKDLFCQNNKCVTLDKLVCYKDADCGDNYGCDNQKCVDKNSCSMTRTCPDNLVCSNGTCTDYTAATSAICSKSKPCADTTKTCVRGTCVDCNCKTGETCTQTGSCEKTNISNSGKVSVGDACDYKTFITHCDGNRKFSCVESQVSVTDCGGNVCANASEEGWGCYSACQNDGDFVGECVGWTEAISFTRMCSKTSDGALVWSLQKGFDECLLDCVDGRCEYVPDDFGKTCTTITYPDNCQGDWLTYCYSGYSTGTACSTYSADHFCALPSTFAQALNLAANPGSTLQGVCAVACSKNGATHTECIKDSEGNVFSMNYLCASTTTGKLADFEAGYTQCSVGCNSSTGLCL